MRAAQAETVAGTERLACLISYHGGRFKGFQSQKDSSPTVQGQVTSALETILRHPVKVAGAGRTDAGVHALRQVIAFDHQTAEGDEAGGTGGSEADHERIRHSLSRILSPDIAAVSIAAVPSGFDPRRDALAREYHYLIHASRVHSPFLFGSTHRHTGSLDVQAMQAAADKLIGEHDFASFCTADAAAIARVNLDQGVGRGTVRRLIAVDISSLPLDSGLLVAIRFEGDAFLHSMVRVMVGTIIEVGAGKRRSEDMGTLLSARSRESTGETAPAHGLYLTGVRYQPGAFDASAPLGPGHTGSLLAQVLPVVSL